MRIFLIKAIKFFIAIVLLPTLPVFSIAIWKHAVGLNERTIFFENPLSYCLGGAILWGIFSIFFRLPTRIYVFAHEWTHVLFIKLCGGKVKRVSVKKTHGYVISNRSNFLITLAPYMFPFYAIIFGTLAMVIQWIHSSPITLALTWISIGFCLGYHLNMTGRMMVTRQTDFSSQGYVFSFVLILLVNLAIVLFLLWVLPTPSGFRRKFMSLLKDLGVSYTGVWDLMSQAGHFLTSGKAKK